MHPLLALGALLLCVIHPAASLLTRTGYSNAVFGSPSAEVANIPTVTLPVFNATSPTSYLFTGTLSAPSEESIFFTATTNGVVRLYVNDHLILDDSGAGCSREIKSWLNWPAPSSSPVPFRLEYTHRIDCAIPALALHWQGNTTARGDVPAEAFGLPATQGPRVELNALRSRLYEPIVPWQTLYAPHMGAHVLQPTGMMLGLSLGDSKGNFLGNIRVFPNFSPAIVHPGGHSYNGSDFTALHVMSWGARNATVSFFTTASTASGGACEGVEGAGGPRCDLAVLASCFGSDCPGLVLAATLSYAWLGVGGAATNGTALLLGTPSGFPSVTVHASTPTQEVSGASFPPATILLPFTLHADLPPWSGPGGGAGAYVAAVSTGGDSPLPLPTVISRVALARVRYDSGAQRFTPKGKALYEPMRAILAWNTVYTHFLHVYTPVSRNWATSDSISTFVWDVFFAAIMLSTDSSDPRACDLAAANTITTMLSRTMSGMVPNYVTGGTGTYDRTEPQLGSWTVRILRDRLGEGYAWLPSLLLPSLVAWSDWFYSYRRNVGVLAAKGAEGLSDAISLGSNDVSPGGLNTPHTLAAARYESGLDNSPQYDGDDGLCSGPICPCTFNASNSMMNLYDVAFTSYFALDSSELVLLALGLNETEAVPRLQDRATRAAAALHTDLYSPEIYEGGGSYANMLLNGTFVPRWAPTVFSPMLTGTVPLDRLDSMMALMADPDTFCVNASHSGSGEGMGGSGAYALLLNFGDPVKGGGGAGSQSCSTDSCVVSAVQSRFGVTPKLQANIRAVSAGPAGDTTLPLLRFVGEGGATALTTPFFAPVNNFTQVGVEGYCLSSPPVGRNDSTPLALWGGGSQPSPTPPFVTCGTAACNASAAAVGLVPLGVMCYAGATETTLQRACAVALPSIGRGDPAFEDQTYWRGRAWAPQAFLVWAGLQRYAHAVPTVAERKGDLVEMATQVFLKQHELFGQVNENLDGTTGLGSDSVRADSYYHWGALNGFIGLVEEGGYPSDVLAPPANPPPRK